MNKPKKNNRSTINITNKKAFFSYHILDKYTAGIALLGTEIKSIRMGQVNLKEAYCLFAHNELWVKNMHISPYTPAAHYNHPPTRTRKLLLKKRELDRLKKGKEEKGHTIIPLRLFISEKGFAKLEIALAKGKKLYDKRASIKERDVQRTLQRSR